MKMPGFTAKSALYRSSGYYEAGRAAGFMSELGRDRVVASATAAEWVACGASILGIAGCAKAGNCGTANTAAAAACAGPAADLVNALDAIWQPIQFPQ